MTIHAKEPCFKDNDEKFNELMNKVKEMKHIRHYFYDLDINNKNDNEIQKDSSAFIKEKDDKPNVSIFKTENIDNINLKKNGYKKIENNTPITNFIDKKYLNKINDDFLTDDNIFKDEYYKVWPNDLNNLLSSTDDFSIKDENNNNNIDSKKIGFENENFIYHNEEKENDLCIKPIKTNFNLYRNLYGENTIEENENFSSNMTNLYMNEFNERKDIYDFVNN